MDYKKRALQKHRELRGKISISLRDSVDTKEKLSTYYTPGVAAVSTHVAEHPEETRDYTWLNNCVAVISDGSAVLGLGDIGPQGALPVMEGKAMLFKQLGDVDAVPIVLDVHSPEEIIATVKAIAPSFGGINLEDIAAPKCFKVEQHLVEALNMPIMHDDQHGTAIVVLAGLINATKVVGKQLSDCQITLVGAGAAGIAVANLLHAYAQPKIIAVDSKGIIEASRTDLNAEKQLLLKFGGSGIKPGGLEDALHGSDIFIGVSKGNLLNAQMVRLMNPDAIIFAMANPDPEILPDEAKAGGAAVIATGRSDFPNQVNNALAFPGIFRGALDNHVTKITQAHKIAAAEALASLVAKPTSDEIILGVLDPRVVSAIASVVK